MHRHEFCKSCHIMIRFCRSFFNESRITLLWKTCSFLTHAQYINKSHKISDSSISSNSYWPMLCRSLVHANKDTYPYTCLRNRFSGNWSSPRNFCNISATRSRIRSYPWSLKNEKNRSKKYFVSLANSNSFLSFQRFSFWSSSNPLGLCHAVPQERPFS